MIRKYYFYHHAHMSKFIRTICFPFLFSCFLLHDQHIRSALTNSTYFYTISKYFSESSRAECNRSGAVPITYCVSMAWHTVVRFNKETQGWPMNYGIDHLHSLCLRHLDILYTQMISSLNFYLSLLWEKWNNCKFIIIQNVDSQFDRSTTKEDLLNGCHIPPEN